eukprot:9340675-Prorocentrum_lima.AAC.1
MEEVPFESGAIPKDIVTIGTLIICIKVTDELVNLVRQTFVATKCSFGEEESRTLSAPEAPQCHLRDWGVVEGGRRGPAPEGS